MVRCADDSLYVGIASDVKERVKRHNWGVGPEFTAKRRPVELIWSERCESLPAARRREKEIKGWSRAKKLSLANVKIQEGDRRLALRREAAEGSTKPGDVEQPFESAGADSQGKGE